jgi:hypothetical protein
MKRVALVVSVLSVSLLAVFACSEQGPVSPSPAVSGPVSPSPAVSGPVGSTTAAKGGGKPSGDIAVITTIEALPAAEISPVGGTYSHGQEGVTSVLMSNTCNGLTWGDWQLSTYNAARRVGHSFLSDSAVPLGEWGYTIPPDPPFDGTEHLPTELQVKCTCQENLSMLAMSAGQAIACPLINRFTRANGEEFALNAGTAQNPGDMTNVQITCLAADTDGCREWSITPIPNLLTQNRAVGRLHQLLSKGKVRGVHRGNFYLRFAIHVTRPVSD